MVDDTTAPTMAALARDGVTLRNGHSLFPTFTTANASAFATGHMLGDTGDFSNTIYTGFEVPAAGNTVTPFLEIDPVLADVDEHFSGNYLDEATILKLARDKGYSTASIGKVGPVLIFDHTARTGEATIIVDDATGSGKGIPLSAAMTERLKAANLPLICPPRGANRNPPARSRPTSCSRNIFPRWRPKRSCRCSGNATGRSFWFTGRAIPTARSMLKATAPIRWCPGSTARRRWRRSATPTTISSKSARRCATSGSSTPPISSSPPIMASPPSRRRAAPARPSRPSLPTRPKANCRSASSRSIWRQALDLPLIDPDDGYKAVAPGAHTKHGNGLIGGDKANPKVVVAANGGSDLIYLPDGDKGSGDKDLAKRVIDTLLTQDYVSGIFVDARLGKFPGTLTLDDIALEGGAITPHPAIVISFRSFDTVCGEPVRCAVEVADTILQQGQGMHGSFSRADTWNFMAMQGPDFKSHFVDPAPASNADIGRTIAQLMGLDVSRNGKLVGRVLTEALPNGAVPEVVSGVVVSEPASNWLTTIVNMQTVGDTRYFDAGGFPGRTVGLSTTILPSR